jgi:uncharacterized protein YbbC (DUF1343 family)
MPTLLGCERLFDSPLIDGRRVGLVCNPASVGADLRHLADRLAEHERATLAALFGPQHGFYADVQDNMIETPHAAHGGRRIPVYSLYSETREPTADMLRGLDVLIVDLQDIGARIYTFIYTMANCLRAAKRHDVPVIVCDRPNPIGGELVEGPLLKPGFTSFVGMFPIPMRHGLTIGELARLFNDAFGIGADVEVLPMEGWDRRMYFDETGLPWVMPSPNIPTLDSATVFPGTVLLEGTNVSEGRGTTRPFELVGAPWVRHPERFSAGLNAQGLRGVRFRAAGFEPTFQKHARQYCGGCQIHVIDRFTFRPLLTGVSLVAAFREAGSDAFLWKDPPYEYEYERRPIDLLWGSSALREQIEQGVPPARMAEEWEAESRGFERMRSEYLLY